MRSHNSLPTRRRHLAAGGGIAESSLPRYPVIFRTDQERRLVYPAMLWQSVTPTLTTIGPDGC